MLIQFSLAVLSVWPVVSPRQRCVVQHCELCEGQRPRSRDDPQARQLSVRQKGAVAGRLLCSRLYTFNSFARYRSESLPYRCFWNVWPRKAAHPPPDGVVAATTRRPTVCAQVLEAPAPCLLSRLTEIVSPSNTNTAK